MRWIVETAPPARKDLERLPRNERKRVEAALLDMRATPYGGDTRKLRGREMLYRRRVGSYRIVFKIEQKRQVVTIVEIGRRTSTTH